MPKLREIAPQGQRLKASVPGAYTLAGRLVPNDRYPDRHAVTEALVPLVRAELERVVDEGCEIVTVDEPSMSCYADREDRGWLVDVFNRSVESVAGRDPFFRLCASRWGMVDGELARLYPRRDPNLRIVNVDVAELQSKGRRARKPAAPRRSSTWPAICWAAKCTRARSPKRSSISRTPRRPPPP